MLHPVGHVLAADAQGGAVFHQAHAVDVGHLGAAHALVDPAHHVTQDALGVVVEFFLFVFSRPVGRVFGHHRELQQSVEGVFAQLFRVLLGNRFFHLLLQRRHVDLVVVHGVQGGGGRAGHPGGVGTGHGVANFGFQHVGHQVRHGPHAFADLCTAAQAAGQAHVDVVLLVSAQPGAVLDVALAHDGAGQHAGVHFVACAVQKARVDEGHAALGGGDTGFEVGAGAALFVHDAQLDGGGLHADDFFDTTKQLVGKRDFSRAVHFGLDDVNAAGAAVAQGVRRLFLQVDQGAGHGDHGVQDAFWDLVVFAVRAFVKNSGVGHQVTHVAHKHERAAVQLDRAFAGGLGVLAVTVHGAGEGLATLLHFFAQGALQNAQPVGIGQHFVVGVHRGDRVFQVEDGGQSAFSDQVGHASRVGLANRRGLVDLQVEVDAVVHEQHRGGGLGVTGVAHELLGVGQRGALAVGQGHHQLARFHGVALAAHVRACLQRRRAVEHVAAVVDDFGAALGVVARAFFATVGLADRIGAIQRVVQRTPTGVGSVQGVTRVQDRHDQLWASQLGQLGVHVGGGGLGVFGLGHQIANLREVFAVGLHGLALSHRAGVGGVPLVHGSLDAVTLGQQGDVFRGQVGHDVVEAFPELVFVHAGGGQHLVVDETQQGVGHLQVVDRGACSHENLWGQVKKWGTASSKSRLAAIGPMGSNTLF